MSTLPRSAPVQVIGGGTMFHIRPHLSLCAPAYGLTAYHVAGEAEMHWRWDQVGFHTTKMAGGRKDLDTNEDVGRLLQQLVADPVTKVIFMTAALCDFEAHVLEPYTDKSQWATGQVAVNHRQLPSGKGHPRLKTADGHHLLSLTPAQKIISTVRKHRKDIFLVGFKTTTGATPDQQFEAGLALLKKSSCNLVLANDIHTRHNMIITPEQSRYSSGVERRQILADLVEMTWKRSQLRFTRTKLADGRPIDFAGDNVPKPLRQAVEHCVARGAYRPFLGKTVGHFAAKVTDKLFLTSIRGSDFNRIRETGMVRVEAVGDDEVIAYGAKPSVGGQSQRIIFREHPETDSIVHFHCQIKPGSDVPVRSQREYECGSHECGQNTSTGLKKFGKIWAVMLDKHGPNIVFNSKETSGQEVIEFIEQNFDLAHQTSELA